MPKDLICGMEVLNERFVFEIRGKKYFFVRRGAWINLKNFQMKVLVAEAVMI